MNEDEKEKRLEFWMKLAGVAFTLWSLAIPAGIVFIKDSVNSVVVEQREFNGKFNSYVFGMERRVTILEERQIQLIRDMADHENENHRRFNGNK